MNDRSLELCMNKILDSLNYDFSAYSVPGFIKHLEELKHKSFHFIPCKLVEHGAFGMWITSDHDELFFYEQSTVPVHRIHIIMHEIGHMLCGHQTEYRTPQQAAMILQGGHFGLVGILRHRQKDKEGKIDDREQEAEMLAILLQERILRQNRLEQLTSLDTTDEITRHYLKSIGLY